MAAAAAAAVLLLAEPPLLWGGVQEGAWGLPGIDFLLVRDRQIGRPPKLTSESEACWVSAAVLAPLSCIHMSGILPPKIKFEIFPDYLESPACEKLPSTFWKCTHCQGTSGYCCYG